MTQTPTPVTTLASLAAEHGIDLTTARLRCDGLTMDHVGSGSPLSPGDASLIRAALTAGAGAK